MSRHWAEAYVGTPYSEFDCAELCKKVHLEQFNNKLSLPTYRPSNLKKISGLISELQDDFAEKVSTPVEGDGVLMIGRGRLNHIGIACYINGQLYVLHAMRNIGMAVLHNVNSLKNVGIEIEGYYRWK